MTQPRQDSLYDQLLTVQVLANKAGCYDAADYIADRRREIKARLDERKALTAWGEGE